MLDMFEAVMSDESELKINLEVQGTTPKGLQNALSLNDKSCIPDRVKPVCIWRMDDLRYFIPYESATASGLEVSTQGEKKTEKAAFQRPAGCTYRTEEEVGGSSLVKYISEVTGLQLLTLPTKFPVTMFLQIAISSLCVWVCSARAVPETYGVLEVLEAQPGNIGPYENMVAATIDILPEIADMLVNISRSRSSLDFTDSNSVLDVILAFLPISEKVMEAMAKAEGRTLIPEERERLARIKDVLPAYFSFMREIRGTNFYGFANRYGSSFSRGSLPNIGKSDSYRGTPYPNGVRSYPSDGKSDPEGKSDPDGKLDPNGDQSDPDEDKTPDKRSSNAFSGSFVKLPDGKSYYISHGGHAQ